MSNWLCIECRDLLGSSVAVGVGGVSGETSVLEHFICCGCFGSLDSIRIQEIAANIGNQIQLRNYLHHKVAIEVSLPAIVVTARTIARIVAQRSITKLGITGSLEETIATSICILINKRFPSMNLVPVGANGRTDAIFADANVTAKVGFEMTQIDIPLIYCRALVPEFKHKTARKDILNGGKREEGLSSADVLRCQELVKQELQHTTSSGEADYDDESKKSLNSFTVIRNKLLSFANSFYDQNPSIQCNKTNGILDVVEVDVAADPVYLFGRYRKYARDVPQSEWLLQATPDLPQLKEFKGSADLVEEVTEPCSKRPKFEVEEVEEEKDNTGAEMTRKGRSSVDEIITTVVKNALNAGEVAMHSCGREDIDVRMLGNGRPFVLRIERGRVWATPTLLEDIIKQINSTNGLNSELDVEVLRLQDCEKSIWTGMQASAETKHKKYMCLVWCSQAGSSKPYNLNSSMIAKLEQATTDINSGFGTGKDESGRICLVVNQRTPLRVLHRRSLMTRIKYIYDMHATQVAANCFMLELTTSAGAYVKEFVHGDFGRTFPNVSEILGCRADIFQLDVLSLLDSYPGNDLETNQN